jgi:hypothetical protein
VLRISCFPQVGDLLEILLFFSLANRLGVVLIAFGKNAGHTWDSRLAIAALLVLDCRHRDRREKDNDKS